MNNGFIFIHRKLKEHWLWKSDNRLKWWLDVLLTVNYADNKVLIGNNLIECNRGQSIRSLESWAKEWNVSKKTVSDFFKLLQKDNMIFIENLKITTRITVCKYDSYQMFVNDEETDSKRIVNDEETDSKRIRYPKKEREKKEKKEKKEEEIIYPQISEIETYFFEKGYSKEAAKKFFDYYSVANWKDSKGNEVKNWKQKAQSVWFKPENELKKEEQKTEHPPWYVPTFGSAEYYKFNNIKPPQ